MPADPGPIDEQHKSLINDIALTLDTLFNRGAKGLDRTEMRSTLQ